MLGAIDTIKDWRDECKEHVMTNKGIYHHPTYCHNCKLKKLCRDKKPSEWTDKDILNLVKIIGGVNNVNKKH